MSDPASAAASIAGLLSLALQSLQYLIQFYMSCKDRDSHIETTLKKLSGLQRTLCVLEGAVRKRTWRPDELAVLRNIEVSVTDVETGIGKLNTTIKKLQKPHNNDLLKSIRDCSRRMLYPFQKDTLEKLSADVDCYRENLALALHVLQTAAQQDINCEIKDIRKGVDVLHAQKMNDDLREWLGAPNATTNYDRARKAHHPGTGRWFLESTQFTGWLDNDNSFLWVSGFQGCGKTVLCSTAIDNTFHRQQSQAGSAIAFFFFAFDDASKQDSAALLRGLIWQLSDQVDGLHADLAGLKGKNRHGNPTTSALMKCLRDAILRSRPVYLFLDAIEECADEEAREEVLSVIQIMRGWNLPNLHLLVTSRDLPDIRLAMNATLEQTAVMQAEHVNQDIESYIKFQLENDLRWQRWKGYQATIVEHFNRHANGAFRLVDCQLRLLRRAPANVEFLETCLESLPTTLYETYERMLSEISPDFQSKAQRLLTLLCCSSRPLTVAEVVDALAVDLDRSQRFDTRARLQDANDLHRICPGLIEICSRPVEFYETDEFLARYDRTAHRTMQLPRQEFDNSELSVHDTTLNYGLSTTVEIVRVAHFSVREYIQNDRIRKGKASEFALDVANAHSQICKTLLIYLCDPQFTSQSLTVQLLRQFPLARLAAEAWHYHYLQVGPNIAADLQTWTQKLLTVQQTFDRSLRLHDADIPRSSIDYHMVHFDSYFNKQNPSPVYYASLLGSATLLKSLIATLSNDLDVQGGYYGSALRAASARGHEEVVQRLLEKGADINIIGGDDDYGGTALEEACRRGSMKLVKILLDKDADPNILGKISDPLTEASSRGYEEMTRELLKAGADPNIKGRSRDPLSAAVGRGDQRMVRLLIEAGADVNAKFNQTGQTPLRCAIFQRDCAMAEILLDGGADVNVESRDGWSTVLIDAAEVGDEKMLHILLKAGADVNTVTTESGISALHKASCMGHEKVVQILLDRGANIHHESRSTGAAIVWAALHGHEAVARMLRNHGADVNSRFSLRNSGKAALVVAARDNNTRMAQILLTLGADVNVVSYIGIRATTALRSASANGNEEMVHLLLYHGADVHLHDPFEAALEGGHEKIVQLLLDNGLRVNDYDDIDGEIPYSRPLAQTIQKTKHYAEGSPACQVEEATGGDPRKMRMATERIMTLLIERGARLADANNNERIEIETVEPQVWIELKDMTIVRDVEQLSHDGGGDDDDDDRTD